MNITLFMAILFGLQLICYLVGRQASKQMNTQEDYFLAGKAIKFFPLLMTFVATQIGGGLILGAAEEAYRFGWQILLYPLGSCLGFLLLALGVGQRLAKFKISTVAQLFELVYQSPFLKRFASALSILSLLMILIGQIIASKKFMVSLGLDMPLLFLVFWGIIIAYTTIGGLKAVVSIDNIQALFFISVFVLGIGYIFSVYTPFESATLVSHDTAFEWNASKLTGWLLMPLLFMVIEQDMAQRCFAANSPKVVGRSAGWAAFIVLIISFIPVIIGVLGKNLNITIPKGSSVFMEVSQALTPSWMASFTGCAVLMAVVSTAISLINAIGSNLTQDFDCFRSQKSSGLFLSRMATIVIGVVAIIGSFYFGGIVDMLIQSYELSVSCLFVPIFVALFKPKGHFISALFAIIFGAVGFILFRYWEFPIPREILSLLLSSIGFFVGEFYCLIQKHSGLREATTE